jgi:hypothetical protein
MNLRCARPFFILFPDGEVRLVRERGGERCNIFEESPLLIVAQGTADNDFIPR